MAQKLCIHFVPGARGDFLASVLAGGNITTRDDFGAVMPPEYLKIHYNFDRRSVPDDYFVIGIDHSVIIDNVMQVALNSILKNKKEVYDWLDHFYIRAINDLMIPRMKPDDYDCYIDFSSLANIDFLKWLYFDINGQPITDSSMLLIEQNIKKQPCWRTNPDLVKLSKLIEFEMNNQVMEWHKSFNLFEFMACVDYRNLLVLENYSKDPWVM